MRVFIALKIPKKIKDHLEKIQNSLRRSGVQATWVKKRAMHTTLIFLGEITPNQAEKTAAILKNAIQKPGGAKKSPIKLQLDNLKAFPNLDYPKVIWAGLKGNLEKLHAIDSGLRTQLRQEKIPFDSKPFVPHLTLARIRRISPKKRKKIGKQLKQYQLKDSPEFKISQIMLIKSQLTPKGPIYTKLYGE